MATAAFKEGITERFKTLVGLLIRRGLAANNTDIGGLMNQPPQAVSKMLSGDRIITLEQISILAQNTQLNANWLLSGEGEVFYEGRPETEDIVTAMTRAMGDGKVEVPLGEQAIHTIVALRNELIDKQDEINDLNKKLVELLELIKKS